MKSTLKSRSFCATLNNVDKLFDKESDFFDDTERFQEKTRKLIHDFREKLDEKINYSPEEIVQHLIQLWMQGKEELRACAINYEIGDKGVHHCHMILEDKQQVRLSAIQKLYPTIHVDITKGTKEEVKSYLNKTGKHEEKAHTIIVPMKEVGNILANEQGRRTDLEQIQELLETGFKPEEIMETNLSFRRYSKLIKEHFYQTRLKAVPTEKQMTVYWHYGESGTGKSYAQIQLQQEHGRDEVYVLSDFQNGGFDHYQGEQILFLDEFKGELSFKQLLTILDKYPQQIHARYTNIYALWTEVHITSIFSPEEAYNKMVRLEDRQRDPIEQLYRRISTVVYHFVNASNDYATLSFSTEQFKKWAQNDIKKLAVQTSENVPHEKALIFSEKTTRLTKNKELETNQ